MRRHEVSDLQWAAIEPLLPGKAGDPGRTGQDNRLFVNAVFWIARTGAPWRDLPEQFGQWNSIYRRFYRWCKRGAWGQVLEALGGDAELSNLLLDSTIIRAHQHAAGAKRGQDAQALGRSRGGFSTKIHVAVNEDGQPAKLHLTEGQRHDVTCGEILLEGLEPEFVIGDKGYDSDPLRDKIRSMGAKPVIPSRRSHRTRRYDRQRYKLRNVVERFINRLKHCRRVATRYDKLATTYLGFVQFASIIVITLNVHTT